MKALYRDHLFVVVECHGDSVELEQVFESGPESRVLVPYGDPSLIIDPTDGDLAGAGIELW